MKHPNLRNLVRTLILGPNHDYEGGVSGGGIPEAKNAAVTIREALAERGLGPNCHVGKGEQMKTNPEMAVEWYAGQFLSIVDGQSWFAMNSLVNCCNKFCGALDTEEEQETI